METFRFNIDEDSYYDFIFRLRRSIARPVLFRDIEMFVLPRQNVHKNKSTEYFTVIVAGKG